MENDMYDVSMYLLYDQEYKKEYTKCWNPLVLWLLERSQYIEFSCWNYEEQIISEVIHNMDKTETWVTGEQFWIKGKITKEISELVSDRYMNIDGGIKWFVICFYKGYEKETMLAYSAHYGTEFGILDLTFKDIESLKNVVDDEQFRFRIG